MLFNSRSIVILVYYILVNLFVIFIGYLEYSNIFLGYVNTKYDPQSGIFDYIVVGCGSAGAVVARRLAEDKNVTILVLEAGSYGHKLLDIPTLGVLLEKTHFDWQYSTTPQTNSCLALNNNASTWPMGKVVGGTGMLNNMIYVRGHVEDFNDWFKNKEGYTFEKDILPYFKKLEQTNDQDHHQGSIFVRNVSFTSILPRFILEAAKRLGFSISTRTEDCEKGFGLPKVNIRNGQRWTPSHQLIHSNKPNVFLLTNRIVEKVIFHDNFEAHAVQYSHLGKRYLAKASKGIILSAGVVGTPKILLHSGIGPKHHLDKVNITNKLDLPVGENLQDHLATAFDLILLNQTIGVGIEQMLAPFSAFDYFWNGAGPWTFGGCDALAYLDPTSDTAGRKSNVRPDLQLMIMPLSLTEDNGLYLRRFIGIKDSTWEDYFAKGNHTAITILPVLLHPRSRGTIRLKDSDIKSKPLIDPNYLSHKEDVEVLVRGIELVKKLANTEEMKMLGAQFNERVFPGCDGHTFDTKSYWECYLRHLTITSYHPVGTCKMGPEQDPTTVVNFNFEVKGTNNLFAVDGSVIPSLPSGNVNGPIMMLAEMASDKLKLRNFFTTGKCHYLEVFVIQSICYVY